MVSAVAVNAALHRIDQQAAFNRGLSYPSTKISFGTKGSFRGFVGNEFNCPEQANPPNIADGADFAELVEPCFEMTCDAAFAI